MLECGGDELLYSASDHSFVARPRLATIGLPLGDLTRQLSVNSYMNEFDQFVKHSLKAKYYIRYVDDFVIIYDDRLKCGQALN